REIGCIVKFATDDAEDGATHWVALAPTSQSVPEEHAMVQIGRASNETEIPEIQQVLSSHGQKTIQPPERRDNHWATNTAWGSNYSTSFGDNISIRYGDASVVNLPQAINIVRNAYDNPGVLATTYENTSFNKGSSFSFSVSDDDARGLANASVSAGSNFSENFSEQSYNVSYTDCSQSFSKTNKSVNVSYLGSFTETIDYDKPSFINGKIPEQKIIDICDGLDEGSSYYSSHITGKSINLSGTGCEPPTDYDQLATVYSNSLTVGKVMNINEQTGDTTNTSTTTGDTTSTSIINGDAVNTSIVNGDTESTSDITGKTINISTNTGNVTSDTTINGVTDNTSTINGDSINTSTVTGKTTNTTTTGDVVNISRTIGTNVSKSFNLSASETMSANIGASATQSFNLAASQALNLNLALSNTLNLTMGVDTSVSCNIGYTVALSSMFGGSLNADFNGGTKVVVNAGGPIVNVIPNSQTFVEGIKATIVGLLIAL
ncbi:MAG: hypothetical protein HRT35_29500, partial [Algicola sp.]|nr:hypothetical protein [Algicola sp.]